MNGIIEAARDAKIPTKTTCGIITLLNITNALELALQPELVNK